MLSKKTDICLKYGIYLFLSYISVSESGSQSLLRPIDNMPAAAAAGILFYRQILFLIFFTYLKAVYSVFLVFI